jgi:phosphinothricin acetyltransferase
VHVHVRAACERDQDAIVAIYDWYVLNSDATFDTRPLAIDARAAWFGRFGDNGPHRLLVAVDDAEQVVGYAGSARYRDHPAFAGTAELTVYVDSTTRASGVGSELYARLLAELAHEPVHRLVAAIALPNDASVALHRRFGFEAIGVFDEYARKGDRWLSSLWMQRRQS